MTKVCPGSTISKEGFSLVEVLVALVVLSVGILAVTTMAASSIRQVQQGFNITNSTLAAQQVLDTYMTLPFDSIALGAKADTLEVGGLDYFVVSSVTDVSAVWSPVSSNVIYKIVVYSGGGLARRTGQNFRRTTERFETLVYNPEGL